MSFPRPQSREEAILQNMLGANNVLERPQSRVEALLQEILNSGGGTTNYENLDNLPQINGTELKGDMTLGLSVTGGKVSFCEEVEQ